VVWQHQSESGRRGSSIRWRGSENLLSVLKETARTVLLAVCNLPGKPRFYAVGLAERELERREWRIKREPIA
jgi:hypothetical protein